MKVRGCAGALVLGCSGALFASQQQPVFRTSADLVTVPVSVRASGTPVGGLKPEDFVVLDNGVPQKIQSAEGESVPADITIVVETSNAMRDYLGTINEQVEKIASMIRPTDRLEVLGVDTYVTELLPLKAAAGQLAMAPLKIGGLSSINDAMVAALLREPDRERPHLIIVISDTIDTVSTADMNAVRDVARQSGATLEIAWVTLELEPGGAWLTSAERLGRAVSSQIVAGPGPTIGNVRTGGRARYWVPHYFPPAARHTEAFAPLQEAAELTGGRLHLRGIFLDRTASGIFNKLYADYRHSYILRYTAEGVAKDGWHEITVTTPKYPTYELHARRGYLVEAPKSATSAESRTNAIVAQMAAELDGAVNPVRWNQSSASMLGMLSDFKAGANMFPEAPRKEFVLALALAEMTLPSDYTAVRASAYDLLGRYARLVRQVSSDDEFEKDWLAAALALAEAPARPADAQRVLETALRRFPAEPRFILARAILADQQSQGKSADGALAAYDAAMASEFTRDEARVRKAVLLNRLGRNAEALETIEASGAIPNDTTLRFWRELIRARILSETGKLTDAIAGYRAALAISPEAQSARVGLMTTLARDGHGADARVVAEAIQTVTADDPWWSYWQADYRFFPGLMARMKGLMK